MASIDTAAKRVDIKIVFAGPTLGGKTTTLASLQEILPFEQRTAMTSIDGEDQRTLLFDYLPVEHPTVSGLDVHFNLYTVAGQDRYADARETVLSGADGIVFVCDSQSERMADNRQSMADLAQRFLHHEQHLYLLPLVLQYNKRDLPNALPVEQMDRQLNPLGLSRFETVATTGDGLLGTLQAITSATVKRL